MNLNYDIATWIKYFIGAFACCFGGFFIGKILLNKKIKEINIYSCFLLILLSILSVINSLFFDNIFQIFIVLLFIFLIYKTIFLKNVNESAIYTIVTYFMIVFSEMTITLLVSLFNLIFDFNLMDTIIKTFLGNILVAIFGVVYAFIFRNIINRTIRKFDKTKILSVITLGIITIFILASSLYKLFLNNWVIDYKFILNTIIFIGSLIITIFLLQQYLTNKELTNKYILLKDYLKTSAELIEKYSATLHKYKNNLIVIKGYLKNNNNNNKAETYIDSMLETYDSKKYNWINKINIIQLDAIRYLIYYKLSKAENNNLKIMVDVSKEIKNYDNNCLSVHDINVLLDIIGELFDNAIYASNESKEKKLNVVNYVDNNEIVLILSNTYKEKIDLSLINKNGYTTKGNGHGLGLYDIDKAIKKHNLFNINYELEDNYFAVTLKIKIK